MSEDALAELTEMAQLMTERNPIDQRIARLLGHPVSTGALGEWITGRSSTPGSPTTPAVAGATPVMIDGVCLFDAPTAKTLPRMS